MSDKAFNIAKSGTWPNEIYNIDFDSQLINPNLGLLPAQNHSNLLRNYVTDVTNLQEYSYNDCIANFSDYGLDTIDTTITTNFSWRVSDERLKPFFGPTFNFFDINVNPGSKNFQTPNLNNLDAYINAKQENTYYSYIIFPNRLFLYPESINYDGATWTLTTSSVILKEKIYYLFAPLREDNFFYYQNYINNIPEIENMPDISNFTITYGLCCSINKVDVPVITFTEDYNPFYYSTILESSPLEYESAKIRPESVSITYLSEFYTARGGMGEIGQFRPDYTIGNQRPTFASSYILRYDPQVSNIQTFQLLQNKNDNSNKYLSDSSYCILSATLDLNTTNLQYFSNYFEDLNLTFVNNVTGAYGSILGVSYTADFPAFKNSKELCEDTVTYNMGDLIINTPYASTSNPYYKTWITKYPPHYYGYKITINDDNSSLNESANLNFYLYSSAIKTDTKYVVLSTFIVSDFNILKYDLFTSSKNDYIKYEPLDLSPLMMQSLSCFYGDNFQYEYSLLIPQWVPVSAAKDFKITYPNNDFGQLSFSLRPTLCSIAGELDAVNCTKIVFSKNLNPTSFTNNILIQKINEKVDYVEVDSSFMSSEAEWPYKNLNNSYISWDVSPRTLYTTINAIDLSGNLIRQLQPGAPVLFDQYSSTICVSGYGPQPTVITLSSQKYNQTTSVITNSALFDYFRYGNLSVELKNLNNLELVRKMQFDCFYNYNNRKYDLPSNLSLNWIWNFGGSVDINTIPVSAFYINGQNYVGGKTDFSYILSSVKINAIPPYSLIGPTLTNLTINASVDTIYGLIIGTYSLDLDDFPDPSLFNADFRANYLLFAGPTYTIAKTRDGQKTITRPNDGSNQFIFKPSDELLPYLNLDSTNYFWNVSSSWLPYNTKKEKNTALFLDPYVASTNVITLCTYNTIFPGWVSAHSVKSEMTLYVIDINEFYKPLEFNVIPEYFWKNGPYLTLTTQNNFTNATAPTAYANKISNSQNFYLSTNKSDFTRYNYAVGIDKNILLDTVNSYYNLVEIPYINGEIDSDIGTRISLVAYNDTTYPEYNGTTFLAPVLLPNLGYELKEFDFNIVSTTYPNTTSNNLAVTNPFRYNPKIVPYNSPSLSFTPLSNSIDLVNQSVISITQVISTNPFNAPAIPTGEGVVTYTLTNGYWFANVNVPAIDGTYNLFQIKTGDFSKPLSVSATKKSNLTLSASGSIGLIIPSTTFDNASSYVGDKNLWKISYRDVVGVNSSLVAFNSAANPLMFTSTVYSKVSSDVFIKFETPYVKDDLFIVGYMVDFGDNTNYEFISNEEFSFHSYANKGTFYVSYTAFFNDGSFDLYQNPNPFIILEDWEIYNPSKIRFTYESILNLPYNEESIFIQPNEWGDVDIFNTAMERLNDNLEYLIGNTQTIDTNSPTVFYGWFGSNSENTGDGIRWYTKNYGLKYYNKPNLATNDGTSYFSNLRDVVDAGDILFLLDGTKFRAFSAGDIGTEILFKGSSDLEANFLDPISIEITKDSRSVFVADPPKNKIYRIDLELNTTEPSVNYTLNVGSLGNKEDTNKFNSPSELASANNSLFVLDYNNNCIKQYNNTLNWIHTYYIEEFEKNKPVSITAHPDFEFLFVLTNKFIVYVFDKRASDSFSSFAVNEINDGSGIVKIITDEVGEFIYILTKENVYKYTIDGYFISRLNLPSDITFTGAAKSFNRSLYFLTNSAIIKVQDILKLHKIGEGLDNDYWTLDQLKIDRNEFAMDINYNRSLVRMAQNIKTFRNSMVSKFVLASEQTDTSIVTYYTMIPISVSDRPLFSEKLESETVGVGVNELHVPQVLNRELKILNDSLVTLTKFLDIENFNVQQGKVCGQEFCWSWGATSCYKLSLPAIKICNINPITYEELKFNTPFSYAPTKTWKDAISNCCSDVIAPV